MPLILGTNSIKDTGYDVANSLRFNGGDSEDLERTPSSSGNNNKNTVSVWLKRARVDEEDFIIYGEDGSTNRCKITFKSNNQLQVTTIVSSSNNLVYETNRLFRDTSAWYHFVFAFDSTLSTSGDRCRVYVNGVEETSFAVETDMGQNTSNTLSTSGKTVYIGSQNSGNFFDGYMAEFVFIDGQQLDPTSFGEFDSDSPNIWKPIDVSGLTFGTNGFYLDFENASSLGADVSGNGNNFTVQNLTSVDQSTDTCTNNFATLNALALNNNTSQNHGVFSEGNLKIVGNSASNNANAYSTIGFTKGKWYMEAKVLGTSTHYPNLGIVPLRTFQRLGSQSGQVGSDADSFSYLATGNKENNGTSSYGDSFTTNDIIGIAADLDNGAIYFSKNGTFQASGDPTSGSSKTNAAFGFTVLDEEYFFGFAVYQSASGIECNFGSSPYSISSGNSDANGHGNFEYSVPSGYFALCTKNLSEHG